MKTLELSQYIDRSDLFDGKVCIVGIKDDSTEVKLNDFDVFVDPDGNIVIEIQLKGV